MKSALKEKLLGTVYQVYESFINSSVLACQKGCSSCCTQSVNITELEGKKILRYVEQQEKNNLKWLSGQLVKAFPSLPLSTTNQFARLCFQGTESMEGEDTWSFTPCIFLFEHICSIYPVRPFVCRSFASSVCCEGEETARLPTAFISLNSTVMQIIEHIDQGKIWGNMNTVLAELLDRKQVFPEREVLKESSKVLRSQPCPGFLIPPEDEVSVLAFINILYDTEVEGNSFGKWITGKHS